MIYITNVDGSVLDLIIMHAFICLTLPVSVDRSSPPITLISPVDWSFCEEKKGWVE